MKTPIVVAVLAVFALGGCSKPVAQAASGSPAAAVAPAAPPPTMADWTRALGSVYQEKQRKDEKDGVTSFLAYFEFPPASKRIPRALAFGKRDAFRNLRFYTPGVQLEIDTSLETYISLRDGKMPVLVMKPYYFGPNGWLFMEQVAVMVDGEVVFSRDFKNIRVDTDQLPGGVTERYDFVATPDDIEGLRKIHPDSKIVIRISGKKGYVTVDQFMTGQFRNNIQDALRMYDAMTAALSSHQMPG
jgi:hypothetical protein